MEYELRKEVLNFEGALRDRVQRKIILQASNDPTKKSGISFWGYLIVVLLLISFAFLSYVFFHINDISIERVYQYIGMTEAIKKINETEKHSDSTIKIHDVYCFDKNGLPDSKVTDYAILKGHLNLCEKVFFNDKFYTYDINSSFFVDAKGNPELRLNNFYLKNKAPFVP